MRHAETVGSGRLLELYGDDEKMNRIWARCIGVVDGSRCRWWWKLPIVGTVRGRGVAEAGRESEPADREAAPGGASDTPPQRYWSEFQRGSTWPNSLETPLG